MCRGAKLKQPFILLFSPYMQGGNPKFFFFLNVSLLKRPQLQCAKQYAKQHVSDSVNHTWLTKYMEI